MVKGLLFLFKYSYKKLVSAKLSLWCILVAFLLQSSKRFLLDSFNPLIRTSGFFSVPFIFIAALKRTPTDIYSKKKL